jgi:hypothetical protein
MCALDGNETVQNMVKHVTRATVGYVEVYARMPLSEPTVSDDEEKWQVHVDQNSEQLHEVDCTFSDQQVQLPVRK